jgi:hypothetical protein
MKSLVLSRKGDDSGVAPLPRDASGEGEERSCALTLPKRMAAVMVAHALMKPALQ